ncbi:MAG: hypothetical protein K0R57_5967 [Paenibacillaceae bacterium]|jgi:uncharacterized membrane protein|nr:hypothetical protein [Paenibacillaceae bacterium]
MRWKKTDLLMTAVGLIPFLLSLVVYNRLPERMATHFGIGNQVDGFMNRPAAVAMLALLGAGVPLLTKAGRRMDPKKENYEKFEGAFGKFRWIITLFMCFTGLFLVGYNLGYNVSPKLTTLGIGLLIIVVGNSMGQIRFNYSFGIKTPWTLANETVWRRTHRMAGPIWMAGGAVILLGSFVPGTWGAALAIAAVAAIVLIPTGYSYWLHRSLKE